MSVSTQTQPFCGTVGCSAEQRCPLPSEYKLISRYLISVNIRTELPSSCAETAIISARQSGAAKPTPQDGWLDHTAPWATGIRPLYGDRLGRLDQGTQPGTWTGVQIRAAEHGINDQGIEFDRLVVSGIDHPPDQVTVRAIRIGNCGA